MANTSFSESLRFGLAGHWVRSKGPGNRRIENLEMLRQVISTGDHSITKTDMRPSRFVLPSSPCSPSNLSPAPSRSLLYNFSKKRFDCLIPVKYYTFFSGDAVCLPADRVKSRSILARYPHTSIQEICVGSRESAQVRKNIYSLEISIEFTYILVGSLIFFAI
jgi:hypothetical protein